MCANSVSSGIAILSHSATHECIHTYTLTHLSTLCRCHIKQLSQLKLHRHTGSSHPACGQLFLWHKTVGFLLGKATRPNRKKTQSPSAWYTKQPAFCELWAPKACIGRGHEIVVEEETKGSFQIIKKTPKTIQQPNSFYWQDHISCRLHEQMTVQADRCPHILGMAKGYETGFGWQLGGGRARFVSAKICNLQHTAVQSRDGDEALFNTLKGASKLRQWKNQVRKW